MFLKLILQLIIMAFLFMHIIKWYLSQSKPLFFLPSSLNQFMAFLVHLIFKIYTIHISSLFIITIHTFDCLGWILWAEVQAMFEIVYYLGWHYWLHTNFLFDRKSVCAIHAMHSLHICTTQKIILIHCVCRLQCMILLIQKYCVYPQSCS